jgi:CRISPR-associated endonuclease/helicase Cas3
MSWQNRLFDRFIDRVIPTALDLPTGLGKTSVIAIWLIARAHGAKVPRRLTTMTKTKASAVPQQP